MRVLEALVALYFATLAAVLVAAFLGMMVGGITGAVRPQWGTTLPTPLAELAAVLAGLPLLLLVRRALRAPGVGTGKRVFRVALGCVLAVSAGGGFFAGLRSGVIPPSGMAAREIIEDVGLRGFRFAGTGDEGSANVSPYREFEARDEKLGPEDVTGLPPGFEPSSAAAAYSWLYSDTIAGWAGPHPWDAGAECRITLDVVEPYDEDPPDLVRATVHGDCGWG